MEIGIVIGRCRACKPAISRRSQIPITHLLNIDSRNGLRTYASKRRPPTIGGVGKSKVEQASSRSNSATEDDKKGAFGRRRKKPNMQISRTRFRSSSPIDFSDFCYKDVSRRHNEHIEKGSPKNDFPVLPLLNASALLDPLAYCKNSARSSHTHGVSQSISGTDAARRLLRGKKELLVSARSMESPVLLEGHGVPKKLFQHCIDMADALLLNYGNDVVECSFHNYYEDSLLPQVVRSRRKSGENRCSNWPPPMESEIDWDHHVTLYLTVMKRISCHLGLVFQRKLIGSSLSDNDEENLTDSPLLFPRSGPNLHWNVSISRGSYVELERRNVPSGFVPVFPIVEFHYEAETSGHIIIRLQGSAVENSEFPGISTRYPTTVTFDACFHTDL